MPQCCSQPHVEVSIAVGQELVNPTPNGAHFGEGFHENSSRTHFNPVVQFEEIRAFQTCTCGQRC